MTHAVFAIPGDITLPTGGYGYARRVLELLPSCGVRVRHVELPGSYPNPPAADLERTVALLNTALPDAVLLIDGLAYGAMPVDTVRAFARPIVALVHHPLCLEAGVPPARAAELKRLETEALAFARRVVVSSPTTARTLAADFAVPADRISIAEPGTDRAQRATGSTSGPKQLLAVGSIVPRKGYDVLIAALAADAASHPLGDWHLTIAGALDRSPSTVDALRQQIAAERLGDRVDIVGPLAAEALDALYAASDIFVMASHYEGYGMVLAEAMARGLPIVATTGGAAAETVPDDAGLKVAPGDAAGLGAAIRRMIDDAALRQRTADASWTAGQQLPTWENAARIIAKALEEAAR